MDTQEQNVAQLPATDSALKGVTEAAAVPQTTGEIPADGDAPAAGVQSADAEFESLIKGKYKKAYDAKVQDTLSRRLKQAKQAEAQLSALSPLLQHLAREYGVDDSDIEGLTAAVTGAKAATGGADRIYDTLLRQSEDTKTLYPAFDMTRELQNPGFRALLQAGVDVRAAYEAMHAQEILSEAMRFTARAVEQRISRKIAAVGVRPDETAMGAGAPATVKQDVSKLTKEQLQEVARRVARGERVSFS